MSGTVLAETVLKGRYHCARCPIGCGPVVQVEGGPYRTPRPAGGLEYETLGSLGGNLMINDIRTVTLANDLCNRCGMDTVSVGQVIGLAGRAGARLSRDPRQVLHWPQGRAHREDAGFDELV